MRRFLIEEYEIIDVDVLRANPDQLYVVELTLDGKVCAGAACVLAEPNAYGIPVRKAIVEHTHVPFSDQEAEHKALLQALRKLYRVAAGRKLRVPQAGIGAGPYGLAAHSPRIYDDLCKILNDHFDYRQPLCPYGLFTDVCVRGGFYMASFVAEKHGLTLEQLKAHCLVAGRDLDARGRLFPYHMPTYRWASNG